MLLNQVSQDKTKTNNRTKEKAIKKLSFRDLILSCFDVPLKRKLWSTYTLHLSLPLPPPPSLSLSLSLSLSPSLSLRFA